MRRASPWPSQRSPKFPALPSTSQVPTSIPTASSRAIIAQSFAEIFFGNCTTLGIPCVIATAEDIAKLAAAVDANPALEVTVDVANRKVIYGSESFPVVLAETAHDALTNGMWDPIGELLESKDAIHARMTALGFANAA
jgi:3-isopropylmalate/(R)-2-methylmalate dehydratase small subunit